LIRVGSIAIAVMATVAARLLAQVFELYDFGDARAACDGFARLGLKEKALLARADCPEAAAERHDEVIE
jgi:hypothetical protein